MTTTRSLNDDGVREVVRDRYARVAREGSMTPAPGCCGPAPDEIAEKIGYRADDAASVPEGANLGVGCGAPLAVAALVEGETVLDLGSGAGFDAFLAAREVGATGKVFGVDMTDEMLEKARDNANKNRIDNVEFRKGYLEDLPIADDSIDVVISNCVINLVPDKAAAYREIARVLRPHGRMIVSDVVLDEPLPDFVADDVAALTGCVAGADSRPDYLRKIAEAGLGDIEIVGDKSFGAVALTMIPPDLLDKAREAGVDIDGVAETVRSLTIRARKP
jgi:SAM-dependent methyltransferase